MDDQPRRHNWRPTLSREARGYGTAHRRLRRQVLAEEPTCRECGEPSQQADHIEPLCLGGPTIRSNYQALCNPCARSKAGREGAMMRARRRHLDRGNGPATTKKGT